jgi:hypothetical protein
MMQLQQTGNKRQKKQKIQRERSETGCGTMNDSERRKNYCKISQNTQPSYQKIISNNNDLSDQTNDTEHKRDDVRHQTIYALNPTLEAGIRHSIVTGSHNTQHKHTGINYIPQYRDRQQRHRNRGKRRDTSSVNQKNPHGERDGRTHQ